VEVFIDSDDEIEIIAVVPPKPKNRLIYECLSR
jgi:hypothetical protein